MTRIIAIGLLAVAAGCGAAWWLHGQRAEVLRTEIGLLREEQGQWARLQAENRRLAAAQVSADELARLRGDHAAVERMRGEIAQLRAGVETREGALARPASAVPAAPALTLSYVLGKDGTLANESGAFDPVALRQQLTRLAPGSLVAFRLKLPKLENGAQAINSMSVWDGTIKPMARELKLKISLTLDRPDAEGKQGGG